MLILLDQGTPVGIRDALKSSLRQWWLRECGVQPPRLRSGFRQRARTPAERLNFGCVRSSRSELHTSLRMTGIGSLSQDCVPAGLEHAAKRGELLRAAEVAGFDVLVTTDKNLVYQQNLSDRKIAIVVLGRNRWSLIRLALPQIVSAVSAAKRGTYALVEIPD